jgi:hypothetical protein
MAARLQPAQHTAVFGTFTGADPGVFATDANLLSQSSFPSDGKKLPSVIAAFGDIAVSVTIFSLTPSLSLAGEIAAHQSLRSVARRWR